MGLGLMVLQDALSLKEAIPLGNKIWYFDGFSPSASASFPLDFFICNVTFRPSSSHNVSKESCLSLSDVPTK